MIGLIRRWRLRRQIRRATSELYHSMREVGLDHETACNVVADMIQDLVRDPDKLS